MKAQHTNTHADHRIRMSSPPSSLLLPLRSFLVPHDPVHSARNLTNRELIGKMDPFAQVHLSNSKDADFKTKVAKDGHLNPVWEQAYIFNLEGREELLHLVRTNIERETGTLCTLERDTHTRAHTWSILIPNCHASSFFVPRVCVSDCLE